jgi:DNA-binding LacI/PurR family transcriptional regulator
MVFIGRDRRGTADDIVVQNDRALATRAVLDHLRDAGAARPAILTLRTFESFTEDCLEAYRSWCADRGVVPRAHVASIDASAGEAAIRGVAETFLSSDDADAVFCIYERLGLDVLAAARARGIRVPEDLLVATISEVGAAAGADPPLTTLDVQQSRLGEIAAGLLCDALDGVAVASVLDVPTTLQVRRSTTR